MTKTDRPSPTHARTSRIAHLCSPTMVRVLFYHHRRVRSFMVGKKLQCYIDLRHRASINIFALSHLFCLCWSYLSSLLFPHSSPSLRRCCLECRLFPFFSPSFARCLQLLISLSPPPFVLSLLFHLRSFPYDLSPLFVVRLFFRLFALVCFALHVLVLVCLSPPLFACRCGGRGCV